MMDGANGKPPERFRRRNLPHWEVPGAGYFVTFRLNGSLPASVAEEWLAERHSLMKEWKSLDPDARRVRQRVLSHKFDAQLDHGGTGPMYLRESPVAETVCEALRHFAGTRYELAAYVVMPDHVHGVLKPPSRDGWIEPLDRVLHSIKSYTAHRANRLLQLTGPFWQREYYDHLLRDESEVEEFIRYTLENPVKAGLCSQPAEWPWSSAKLGIDPPSGER